MAVLLMLYLGKVKVLSVMLPRLDKGAAGEGSLNLRFQQSLTCIKPWQLRNILAQLEDCDPQAVKTRDLVMLPIH